ncbi:MAG: hypothetical protein HOI07_01865 [Betaproteobacteria bacterium]|jgi:DNA-directed RNA polymerase subunit M/transcription elongation factor TFIIS|nr:hypothetical protein [Betaproteobacteria bacterium]
MDIRNYVVKKYASLLDLPEDHVTCLNLEKSTHNWAVKKTREMGDTPARDNRYHMDRYKHKFLEIQKNLGASKTFRDDVRSGRTKSESALNMSLVSMWPDGPYAQECERNAEKCAKKEYSIVNEPDYVGIFKCARCRQNKTTYYELQTRSADEPMTVFVTCHVCKTTWKS